MQVRPQSPHRSPHKLAPRCRKFWTESFGPRAWAESLERKKVVGCCTSSGGSLFVSDGMVGEKLFQDLCVFIRYARKLNPVTNLWVAGRDDARGSQHHAIQPKCHRQRRPRRKRKPRLNVTSTRTDVAGCCANWGLRSIRAQLQLDGNLASEMSPPFRRIRGGKVVPCIKRNVALLFWEASLQRANRPLDGGHTPPCFSAQTPKQNDVCPFEPRLSSGNLKEEKMIYASPPTVALQWPSAFIGQRCFQSRCQP